MGCSVRPDDVGWEEEDKPLHGCTTNRRWVLLLLSIHSGFKKPLTLSSTNYRFKSQAGSRINRKDPLMIMVLWAFQIQLVNQPDTTVVDREELKAVVTEGTTPRDNNIRNIISILSTIYPYSWGVWSPSQVPKST